MARVAVERTAGGVATVTFEGPRLDPDLEAELAGAAEEIDADESVRVAVLRSRGRDFCRGSTPGAAAEAGAGSDAVAAVAALRVPVIALLQGRVLDEGLELALACDFRLASEGARLGLTQARLGRLPRRGGTQRLPRLVGSAVALRMILLGEEASARRAVALGLATRVVAPRRLRSEGRLLAERLAARGPIALRLCKEALRAAHDLPLAEGLRLEGDLYVLLQTTRDRAEGIASFRERRRPVFRGR